MEIITLLQNVSYQTGTVEKLIQVIIKLVIIIPFNSNIQVIIVLIVDNIPVNNKITI